jgi:hypothetical protein
LVYTISTKDSTTTALNKTVELSLFFFSNENLHKSNSIKINLDYHLFNFANKISVIRSVAEEVAAQYEKVIKLTELNLEMYKEIENALGEVNN